MSNRKIADRPRGFGLQCPRCNSNKTRVIDSRPLTTEIIRQRQCSNGHKFITAEKIEQDVKGI